ncbi:CBS domain-containing protein [Halorussus halophilus]|uniref:CBS domain-containing protein n=1 Tax=Halorussus halophilus TaxID=2650975 RepID=UPI00130171D5|nr:CBS domain-containing protein [Halorussus halophilus]
MDISDIVSTEFETVGSEAPVSKLTGKFEDPTVRAVVVTDDGQYRGVVTRRQLSSGHHVPDEKAKNLVWHVATVEPHDDVREVARLMVGGSVQLLPVFKNDALYGVVTADAILETVASFLSVLTVEAVYTHDLVTADPETTLGEVLHTLREHTITHLPVVDEGEVVGIVSLFDVLRFSGREIQKGQGGSPPRFDSVGGRSHGGFGERSGELERMLNLPVRDLMSEPVLTTAPETGLDEAVEAMLTEGVSALVVTAADEPVGIVTKTDVLRVLTVTDEDHLDVQIVGINLMDDISREEVSDMIERLASKYRRLSVLEANVYLHEHKETFRGTPLVLARIRLFTDKGHFVGTGEGYGAAHALRLASNVLERQILEGKEYARTKKHPSNEEKEKLLGWWLSGDSRRR